MNFFERQERARSRSRRLIVLFVLAVLAIMLAANLAVLFGLGLASPSVLADAGGLAGLVRQRPGLLLGVSAAVLAVITLGSLARTAGLREGGGAVARQLGGVPLPDDGGDLAQRRLRNVVEEVAIASGLPVPEIYVLEHEPGINAFAAGYGPADAAVAVTRGALDRLNRDELQGVIAHEFSHIRNGDMRLNIRLVGVLYGILMLGLVGRRMLRFAPRGRNSRGAAPVLLMAVMLTLIGYVGVLFGRLIKAGVSRQREYLADASAVQFTRQTRGIAGALKKIAGLEQGSHISTAEGEEVSHMLFGDGVGLRGLFATHPPLLARIQVLEPDFRVERIPELKRRWAAVPPSGLDEDRALGLDEARPPSADGVVALAPEAVAARVGEPGPGDHAHARRLLGAFPDELLAAAHSRELAPALLRALLLSEDSGVRERQLRCLDGGEPGARERVERLGAGCSSLHPMQRLPLAELAFPRLRRRPRAELEALAGSLSDLAHADRRLDLFEYALATLLQAQVLETLDPPRPRFDGRLSLPAAREPALQLLAILAARGHAAPEAARRAFQAGLARLFPGQHHDYAPPADWASALDAAWPRLDALRAEAKRILIEALVACVEHDGRLGPDEAELLRTACGVLHCPLPPLLADLPAAATVETS